MAPTSVNDIRTAFLAYFRANDHEIVASSPLVPRNDPSLMFTNAGMVPFKNVFTGQETRPYKRAATLQKCVRAGGKHNDLDNVGYTARHHTFFEMLGNFSFGDYFKEEAIGLAWNLLTKEFGLNPEKLLVTVYHEDEDAARLWQKITGFHGSKIIRIATHDNFWAMGDSGPCGPCSEIFYDHGAEIWGGPPGSAEEDGDRFIEIWNLVFMQYDQLAAGERVHLPRPSIDTGMGLERIAAVLQGVHDDYDIDLFRTLIRACEDATGIKADGDFAASHRVIADHLRSSAFLIADGILPSNEGRGYVLRRIMRRAMRHAQLLGAKEPLLWRLLPVLIAEMGQAYPELIRAEALIAESLRLEETRFGKTLERGLGLLDEASEDLQAGDVLAGEVAFKLYDTYGFPLDLTQDALRRRDISVDVAGFDAAMAQQKQEARKNWAGSGEAATENLWFDLRDRLGASEFIGYDAEQCDAIITAIICDGEQVSRVSQPQDCALIANQTPFYGESGGQIGDTGTIGGENFSFTVHDTQKKDDGVFVHIGTLTQGQISEGATARLTVNGARRTKIRANHSATHLLHKALRQVLGKHVAQKGSLVSDQRLRFDFSHPKPVSAAELAQIAEIANEIVLQNRPVTTRMMAVDEAIAQGAMALFGEKYGDEVRVVSVGEEETSKTAWSVELCGGTHVKRSGDIGLVHIVAESAVSSGVRRIEALTGQAARLYLHAQNERLQTIANLLKTTDEASLIRLEQILEERRRMERELADTRRKLALGGGHAGQDAPDIIQLKGIGNIGFLGRVVKNVAPRDLKGLVDAGKNQIGKSETGKGIVVFIGVGEDDKASVVVGVSDDLTSTINAVDLVCIGAAHVGGKGGGGRPDMAQAGGPNGIKANEAIAAIRQAITTCKT